MPATRESWRILPCPTQRAALKLTAVYGPDEFEQIRTGLIPREMEDKWFIYFEAPWLYLHRSWTGSCIYGVRLEPSPNGVEVVESWVSRNAEEHRGSDVEHEERVLKFLIEALLLKKMVAFPLPASAQGTPKGLYQHAVIGRSYREAEGSPARPTHPLWRRILEFFR